MHEHARTSFFHLCRGCVMLCLVCLMSLCLWMISDLVHTKAWFDVVRHYCPCFLHHRNPYPVKNERSTCLKVCCDCRQWEIRIEMRLESVKWAVIKMWSQITFHTVLPASLLWPVSNSLSTPTSPGCMQHAQSCVVLGFVVCLSLSLIPSALFGIQKSDPGVCPALLQKMCMLMYAWVLWGFLIMGVFLWDRL